MREHHARVRRELGRFGGREIGTAGDGFLAVFDDPERAIGCACAVRDGVRELGIDIRTGLHSGEVQVIEGSVGGIGVHIGARVAALAGRGEVLVSSTVRDLVAGSGLSFEDRGTHVLRGVPGEWRLFAVAPETDREGRVGDAQPARAVPVPPGPARRAVVTPEAARRSLLVALALLVVLGLGWWVRQRGSDGAVPISASSVAVFPFSVRASDEFPYLGDGMVDLLSTKVDGAGELERGRIQERRGDPQQAAAHYARFVDLWKDCDPELRPILREAERGLARVRGKS